MYRPSVHRYILCPGMTDDGYDGLNHKVYAYVGYYIIRVYIHMYAGRYFRKHPSYPSSVIESNPLILLGLDGGNHRFAVRKLQVCRKETPPLLVGLFLRGRRLVAPRKKACCLDLLKQQ